MCYIYQPVTHHVLYLPTCDSPCVISTNLWLTMCYIYQHVTHHVLYLPTCDSPCVISTNLWLTMCYIYQPVTHHVLYLPTCDSPCVISSITDNKREREMFYLTTHSTHCIYGYMASDIWLRTILIVRKETRCRHIGYSYWLTARVLLYAPSHRQDNTYQVVFVTPVVEHWLEREIAQWVW